MGATHYPWARLARLRRASVETTNAALRLLAMGELPLRDAMRAALDGLGLRELSVGAAVLGSAAIEATGHDARFRLRMPGSQASALLSIDAALADGVVESLLAEPGDVLGDDRDFGVLAYVVSRCLAGATRAGLPPVVVDVERCAAASRHELDQHMVMAAAEISGAPKGWVRLFVPREWLRAHEGGTSLARVAERRIGRVSLHAMLSIADAALTIDELAGLRAEDVLLFEHVGVDGGEPDVDIARLCFEGGATLSVRLAVDTHWQAHMLEGAVESHTEKITRKLSDAEVRVDVVVGRMQLDIASIAALGPGQVFVTEQPVGGLVELVATGETFAMGELVDVDGMLGVRIVELL